MVQSKATKTKVQLQELVRRFCSAKELMFVTEGDAREIVNSGLIEIVKIPLKGKATSGEYNCLICPLTQGHHRGFKRKEDMKRHNQLHFKVFIYIYIIYHIIYIYTLYITLFIYSLIIYFLSFKD